MNFFHSNLSLSSLLICTRIPFFSRFVSILFIASSYANILMKLTSRPDASFESISTFGHCTEGRDTPKVGRAPYAYESN